MENNPKQRLTVPDSENSTENPGVPRELRLDEMERVSGAGYCNDPGKKRRKLQEGKP